MEIISDLVTKSLGLDDKMQILENKLDILFARASDINSELEMAELQVGKKRRREVEQWLKIVRVKESEVESIGKEVRKSRHLLPYMQLKNHIGKVSNEIEELMHQGKFSNGLLLNDFASRRLPLVTPRLVEKMFEQNIKTISAWVVDDKVQRMGIYGIGGAGKTTLMMHIHNMLLDKRSIGDVYWVTVTQGSTNELQNKIARAVGLDLPSEEDIRRRAATLSSTLSRIGKIILILDDMWKHFPLEEIGVPLAAENCKFIVTSRSLDVCRRMGCQKYLKVEPLPETEAWHLFLDNLGNYDELPAEAKKIAELVARECGGLPLGIRTMATSMRGMLDVQEWGNALQELRKPARGQVDMENEVFPVLKFSYCNLNDVRLQKCFLSCVLYPEDLKILRDELIELWISEELLDEIGSRHGKFQKAHTILNRLENSCLLEGKSCSGEKCVMMHDLMRDMAINITKTSPRYMLYPGAELSKLPPEEQWPEDLEKVSFFRNHITEVPPELSPNCPTLITLFLQCNPLEKISDSFFTHMKSLKVLNLSFTNIKRLPDSLSQLETLSALLLKGCWNLSYLPPLIRLGKLKELDLRHTRVREAPEGMEGLTNLEYLDLSQIKDLSMPFSRILPRLSNLQVLKLSQSINGKDLTGLGRLERLQCQSTFELNDWRAFKESRHHWKLMHYNFIVQGAKWRFGDNYGATWQKKLLKDSDRILIICKSSFNGRNRDMLPHNIEFLGIIDCAFHKRGLIDAFPSLRNAAELRVCEIKNCEGIEYIWSPTASAPLTSVASGFFSYFRKLDICSCPRIKKLFPVVLLEQRLLPNLQEIELMNCPDMEEIIEANEDQEIQCTKTDILSLPNLKVLSMCNLPKLNRICRGLLVCSSLIKFSKESCPKLNMIPLSLPLLCDSSDCTLRYLPTNMEWWTSLDKNYPKDVQILRRTLIKQSHLPSVL